MVEFKSSSGMFASHTDLYKRQRTIGQDDAQLHPTPGNYPSPGSRPHLDYQPSPGHHTYTNHNMCPGHSTSPSHDKSAGHSTSPGHITSLGNHTSSGHHLSRGVHQFPSHHMNSVPDRNAVNGYQNSTTSASYMEHSLHTRSEFALANDYAQSSAPVPYRPIRESNDLMIHALKSYPRSKNPVNLNLVPINQSDDSYSSDHAKRVLDGHGISLPSLVNPSLPLPNLRQQYMIQTSSTSSDYQSVKNYEAFSQQRFIGEPQNTFGGFYPLHLGNENRPPPYPPGPPQNHGFAMPITKSTAVILKDSKEYGVLGSSTKLSKQTEGAFEKLVPLINSINAYNFGDLLIGVLRSCPQRVSLDDFYNLLYNSFEVSGPESKSKPEAKSEGLQLCRAIIEVFKKAENPAFYPQIKKDSSLCSVNFHELLRTFLAIKIVFDSLEEVSDSPSNRATLPRLSIYKVYYITCQNLIHNHPTDTNNSSLQQKLILGQSRLGKLTKLVYPNLVAKRLGKRGQSKYNYIGLRWNRFVVAPEIIDMLDLDINQLRDHFKPLRERVDHGHKNLQFLKAPVCEELKIQKSAMKSLPSWGGHTPNKPMYSYIEVALTYPHTDCSPRIWRAGPGAKPKLSAQAKQALSASLKVLEHHSIDLAPLVINFSKGLFFEDSHSSLSKTVIRALDVLSSKTSESIHLHLYLAVFLLAFPSVLASDQEITYVTKTQLRVSLRSCINSLEEFAGRTAGIDIGLSNFTKILEKMIHLNEMTSSSINDVHVESVTRVIVRDLDSIETLKSDSIGGKFTMEEIFIRGIVMSINAYKFKLNTKGLTSDATETVRIISIIAKTFVKAVMSVRDALSLSSVTLEKDGFLHETYDLPYKIFKLSAMAFHEICLSEPFVLQLPIPVITYIVLNITNEMQNVSFHDFGNRDPGLSKDTFKTWWVFSTTFQEYMSIISEIIALTQRLA